MLPKADRLVEAYKLFIVSAKLEKAVEELLDEQSDDSTVTVPDNLESLVRAHLEEHPGETWDNALKSIAGDNPSTETPAP